MGILERPRAFVDKRKALRANPSALTLSRVATTASRCGSRVRQRSSSAGRRSARRRRLES